MRGSRDLADRLVRELDQPVVEQDRLDRPDPLPLELQPLLLGKAVRGCLRVAQHLRERRRVEIALVEEAFRRLDDRGDDARLRHDAAHRADRALAGSPRDLADLELELGGARERVAALRHRRRAGVRGLALPRDPRPLDPERPEHDAERQVHRLEHRPLLDVQLEVSECALELLPCIQRPVEVDAVRGDCVGKRHAVRVAELPQLVLVGHRAGRRARPEERAAETRALLVGPVHEPHGHRRLALLGDPPQHLDARHDVQGPVEPAAVRDGVDVAADQERAVVTPRKREPLAAGLVGLLAGARPLDPPGEPLPRPRPRVRPGHTLSAVLVARQLLQLAELGDGAGGIERHRARA